jgi:hypothetical protein
VPYLRDLLVSCGILPAVDKQLREFGAWLDRRLEALAGHPHLRLLRQFGLWHQLPAMRARIATGPLRTTAAQYARSRFIQAQTFLTWTAALGVRPSALTQAHIDAYYASHGTHQREGVRAFLVWAAGHGHIPRHLDIPRQQPYAGQVITQQRRLDLLRRFATDTAIPVRPRAAACLMLLYAQPLSRILRLSAADLSRDDDGQTWLRLGDPPSPSPLPSARCCTTSPPPVTTMSPPTTAATGCSPAAMPASPPSTAASPPSSASTACRCAPPASPRCASSSCRSLPPSSPTPSASTTPPPPASTSTPAPPGATTSQAAGHPHKDKGD